MTGEMSEGVGRLVPTYDLSSQDADILTKKLIAERFAEVPSRYRFVGLEIAPGDTELGNLARRVEEQVFNEKFSNDSEVMQQEYGPYEEASRFFISVDRQEGKVSGVLRVIENSEAGLKTLNDVSSDRWEFNIDVDFAKMMHGFDDLDKVWDVGTVAVVGEYRGGHKLASIQLYRAMYASAQKHGIDHLVAIIDVSPLKDMTDELGIPFRALGGSSPHPYIDSPASQAVYGYVPEFDAEAHYFHRRTALLRTVFKNNALSRLTGSEDDSIIFTQ